MKLGKKASEYYDNPKSKSDMINPSCNLPAAMFKGKYKPGDTVSMKITGTVKHMGENEYHIEMTDGVEHEPDSDDKKTTKGKSLLADAKTDT